MLKFGFIGVGQGGGNVADIFAKEMPTIAINSARQDLESLSNVAQDLRIFCEVSSGGAGKNAKVGEYAIIKYRDTIRDKIKMAMRETDFVWLVAGLGGGTGSLGIVQLISILASIGKKHGVICTIPCADEGTNEKLNALISLNQLYVAQKSKNFRSLVIIDNERLKERVMESGSYSYEQFWAEANKAIYNSFHALCDYAERSSITAFDTEDYRRVLEEKGCLIFAESEFEFDESETVLASKVHDLWRENIFLSGDISKATGCALVIERPANFDRDGKAIDRLFSEVKQTINSGLFCRGVYSRKSLADAIKRKPIRIFTVLSGIPFPAERIRDLKAEVERELSDLKSKRDLPDLGLDIGDMLDYIAETSGEETVEELDFSVFSKPASWGDRLQ